MDDILSFTPLEKTDACSPNEFLNKYSAFWESLSDLYF